MLGCGGAKVDPLPCLVLLLQEPRKGRLWDSPELSPLWGLFSRSYQACASSMGDRLFQVCAFLGVGAAVGSHSKPGPVHPSLVPGAPAPSPTSPKCAGPGPSVPCARWRVPWPHGSREAARRPRLLPTSSSSQRPCWSSSRFCSTVVSSCQFGEGLSVGDSASQMDTSVSLLEE